MEFVKEFVTFLHQKEIIKFGDFTLASGKSSSYYVDLRLVPSYPREFRMMTKYLENQITEDIGLDNFESIVSVPTGGLVIASEPNPPLHSATKIARPSFLIAFEQFQREESDFPR